MKSLKSLCNSIRMKVEFSDKECPWEKQVPGTNSWKVTLYRKGKQMTVDFYTGPALGEPREAHEIMDCLLSDAQSGEMSFSEFCREFGYDEDSRRAERIHKECEKSAEKTRRFLGEDFEAFLYSGWN